MSWNSNNGLEQRRNGRVLVVDDEANFRKLMQMMLTKGGYEVVEAEDGAQALEIVRASKPLVFVDVIICDIRMPQVDGVEAVAVLRQEFPSIPVVVLTGFPDIVMAHSFLEQGVSDYRAKPIEREKLLAVVANAMKHRIALKGVSATASTG
jgi:two-component system, chemotaxis family, chemotaxis protein CheY